MIRSFPRHDNLYQLHFVELAICRPACSGEPLSLRRLTPSGTWRRTEELEGRKFLDRLGPMFVGTIHGWCFHMLQDAVPHFGNYEVIDEHRHAAFLSREASALKLKDLGKGRHWTGIHEWIRLVDVIGNELMTPDMLENAGLRERYEKYLELMERFHFLTFSRIIAQAVAELEKPVVHQRVCGLLRHLVADEYQDITSRKPYAGC